MSLLLNAEPEVVASSAARCGTPLRVFCSQERRRRRARCQGFRQGVKALGTHPQIGRPIEELPPQFREWVIQFGHGAYVALYHYDEKEVVILAVRHSREAGY
jgi:plasmid stabilization system protein ParE